MDNGERILYRDMLRRTERATAREREREQEQRGRVPSSAPTVVALPRHHTFYKNLSLSLQSPQGARFNPISVHRLIAIKAGYGPRIAPRNWTNFSLSKDFVKVSASW